MDKKTQIFQSHSALLISMIYRMTGSLTEAEDIVQETALEWHQHDLQKIQNPKAWLIKVCTNKALDHLKKAYKKREVYPGTWLPEIIPNSLAPWKDEVEKKESLHTSFLILLESLSPQERVVYILRQVFEYSFKEISEWTRLTDTHCRKIYERSKKRISSQKPAFDGHNAHSLRLLKDFFDYASQGNEKALQDLLHSQSEFWSDGGGKVSALPKIEKENEKISRFLARVFKNLSRTPENYKFDYLLINHLPGVIISRKEQSQLWALETLFSFEFTNNKVSRIYAQRNPEKLQFTGRLFEFS